MVTQCYMLLCPCVYGFQHYIQGKSCSFSVLCVSFVNIYKFVCAHLSLLVLKVGCGI